MANKIYGTTKNSTSYKKSPEWKPVKSDIKIPDAMDDGKVIEQPSKKSFKKSVVKRGGKDTLSDSGKAINQGLQDTGEDDL